MHKYLAFGLTTIISVLAGFYLCILIRKYTVIRINPTVSFEVNPLEIFSLVTTIALTIYVARTLSKANDLEKSEKDLLISYLTSFKNEIGQKISRLVEQSEFDNTITNSNFKIMRKKVDSIISLSIEYKFIGKDDPHSNELVNKVRDLWELFTDAPRKANGKSTPSVKEDIERLRLERVTKIEVAVIEIEKLIFELILKINRKCT